MTKLVVILFLSFSITNAAGNFEDLAKNLLEKMDGTFEVNQDISFEGRTKKGTPCSVQVSNRTGLNPAFPASSQSAQSIQISVSDPSLAVPVSNFKLNRKSTVLSLRTTSYMVSMTVENDTFGIPQRMNQSLIIMKQPSDPKSVMVGATDFSGKKIECAGSLK